MTCVLPVSRQVKVAAGRALFRVIRRRLATEAAEPPKKKPKVIRRILYATATLAGTFYIGSTFIAFKNQTYYDFFTDNVPLGQSMLEFAESRHWDTMTLQSLINSGKNTVSSAQQYITDKINGAPGKIETVKDSADKKLQETKQLYQDSKATLQSVASEMKTQVQETTDNTAAVAKHQLEQFSAEVQSLAYKAEEALTGIYPENTNASQSTPSTAPSPPSSPVQTPKNIYDAPLPVGFEPPPGFARPAPPTPTKKEEPQPQPSAPALPRLAAIITSPEPVIAHLAGTIDSLTSFAEANPLAASQMAPVLEKAKNDLSELSTKMEKVVEEERSRLEAQMDEQTREYTIKLLEVEMAAQDKLDDQELAFRKIFDEERMKLVQSYREKLQNELKTQTELINERLKEEVIAQGIELQRRWIREIKVHVEQERGGRLAKLDELSAHLKRVERIALDNSVYLDENIRIHALWSAIRVVSSSALTSPVRKPFREELRVLRHVATAREDPVVSATLESLEASNVPDVGIEPFADLATWFTTSVAPKVSRVALVPDTGAGLLSHMASYLFSGLQFRRHGLVQGNDVLSVLARAEHYLNEKDLDSAARELNQLKGTAKVLLQDWLDAARKRLEVQQALEVVQAQATFASLQVV